MHHIDENMQINENIHYLKNGIDLNRAEWYSSGQNTDTMICFFKCLRWLNLSLLFFPCVILPVHNLHFNKPTFHPGGVLELFFDGVCGPRSETLTHI